MWSLKKQMGTYIDLLCILRNTTFNYKWTTYSCGAVSFTYFLVELINEKLVFCLYINAYGEAVGGSASNCIRAKTYSTPITDCACLCIKLFKYLILNCNFYFIQSFCKSVIRMWVNWCFCFSYSDALDLFAF